MPATYTIRTDIHTYIQTSWSIISINERQFTHEIQTIHICSRELKIFQNC